MTKTLRIDDQDYADMRRLFGRYFDLDSPQHHEGVRAERAFSIPHAREEFADLKKLKKWAVTDLAAQHGKYYVRKIARYKRLGRGDILFLQKDRCIVGYASVEEPVVKHAETRDGFTYEGFMKLGAFHPFESEITFDQVKAATGEDINPRAVQLLRHFNAILDLRA